MSKKIVEVVSKLYINAKRSSHEMEGVTRGLIRGGTSVPLRGTPQEVQQVHTYAHMPLLHMDGNTHVTCTRM